jgi:flavin-binding protein dodecin
MTSGREERERDRKATASTQGGREKERRGSALTRVAKIVEIVGTSDKSWEDAAIVAVEEARKTIRGIRGIKVKDMTAKIEPIRPLL